MNPNNAYKPAEVIGDNMRQAAAVLDALATINEQAAVGLWDAIANEDDTTTTPQRI